MTDEDELEAAYNTGYSCAMDMARDKIKLLRAENDKLRINMEIIYLAATELPIDERDTFTVRYRRIKEQYERDI